MKKLSLNLDELTVDSFTTRNEVRARGTVRGNDATDNFGSECCWQSDTQCVGTGWDDSYCCGSGTEGPSHAPSCGDTCRLTGIPYKCYDGGDCIEW